MGLLDRLRNDSTPHVALLVDGPNCFREDFDVDLADLGRAGKDLGTLSVSRIYFDERASAGLLQAAEAHGFETVVTSGDVDVRLATDAAELVVEGSVEVLAITSRDMDFKPAFELARRHGIRTVAIAPGEHGRSSGLAAAADEALTIGE